jgi:Membrane protein involved in the export of O-antigen and teichoic acid
LATYSKITKVGFIWSVISRSLGELIGIPTAMVLARLLTPYDFGVAAAAGFFVQLSQRLTNFGFNQALVQHKDLREEHKSVVFIVNGVIGVLAWLVLMACAPLFSSMFRSRDAAAVIPMAGLSIAIGAVGGVPAALLVRDLKFKEVGLLDSAAAWMTAAVSVLLAWLGWGYWSLIYSQIFSISIITVLRFRVARWWPRFLWSRAALMQLLSFGVGLHFKRLLESVAQNCDNLVVGNFLGLTALGYYDKAFSTMQRAVTLLNAGGPAVSLRVLAIIQDDDLRFRAAYRKLILTATLMAYPAIGYLILVAPHLILFLFGPQWISAVLPFQVLCAAGLLKVLNMYVSTAAQSKGQVWGEVWRQLLYVALIVIGTAIGSRFGLPGAAVGVLAATLVVTVLMHEWLARITGLTVRELLLPQVPAWLCAGLVGLMVLAARFAVRWIPAHGVTNGLLLGAETVAALLTYAAFIRFAPFVELRTVVDDTIEEFSPWVRSLLRMRPAKGVGAITSK